ncbi:MAG: hypothetical protein QXD83_06895, partial [Sulfolobales archaeon]
PHDSQNFQTTRNRGETEKGSIVLTLPTAASCGLIYQQGFELYAFFAYEPKCYRFFTARVPARVEKVASRVFNRKRQERK